jgi:hydrogenase maturation protease
MSRFDRIAKIADAVLWEGYMLYPYRPSNVKNRQRWTFGGLYPVAYAERKGEASKLRAEVLVRPSKRTCLTIIVRFLHLLSQEANGRTIQRAMPREVMLSGLSLGSRHTRSFSFPALDRREGEIRTRQERIEGVIQMISAPADSVAHTLTITVTNTTQFSGPLHVSRDEASMQALVATHAILHASNGGFVSAIDPPRQFSEAASRCANQGVWPVLAGEPGSTKWMLAPPMILPDYPQIAEESPGDLFDGTEIDEILTLRVLTMSDAEKEEMRRADPRLGELLERTESLTQDEMLKLHGVLRNPRARAAGTE